MTVPFEMPRVLAWEVTRQCPLHCRHCRAAASNIPYARELDTAECRRVIDSLAPHAPGARAPMIIWTGGEPMLRADILTLVRAASAHGIRSVMAPCGMLVTEARLRELQSAGVMACSFSLDGPDAATHDSFRGVPGAFENVTRAMSIARAIGMPFQVNTTVSRLNIDALEAIYEKAVALGAAKLDVFFLVAVGRGRALADYALSAEQTRAVLDWCFRKAQSGPLAIKETCCPSAPGYWMQRGCPGPRPTGCLGGRGFAFLSHTGDLQTCGFIDVPCGNIRDFACDFRALIAAAANPLGATGTCRSLSAM